MKQTSKGIMDREIHLTEQQHTQIEGRLNDALAAAAGDRLARIAENVEQVIIGKREAVDLVLIALVAGGHVLIEDVPGVGKTSLVSAVARSIACGYKRIQFTPDLMPSDVTGFSIYNQKNGEFEFRPGAVMSNLILADEINRASAKTQASLLEAMEERQVTVDAETYQLDAPFMVLATQNPLESFGTYPLPEAQIDRFLLKLSMGYPSPEEEARVVSMRGEQKKELAPVASQQDILNLKEIAAAVYVSDEVTKYIIDLVTATRNSAEVSLGSSPRGSIALYNASRVKALMDRRKYVLPDDVKYLAPFVLGHRIVLSHEAKTGKKTAEQVIASILSRILVPLSSFE